MSTVITKRKLEEAVSALDGCSPLPTKKSTASSPNQTNPLSSVRTPTRPPASRPPPTSPYNLLASSEDREPVPSATDSQSPETVKRPKFRPWDKQDFLQRLETYQISTWFGKPDSLNAAECTKRGWHNVGMEKLACRQCNAELNVRGVEESSALKYVELLNEAHKDTCPWKNRSCNDTIYTLSFVSSLATLSEYRERAKGLITMFRETNRVPKIESELTSDEILALTNVLSTSSSPSSTPLPTTPSCPSIIHPASSPPSDLDSQNVPTESESESQTLPKSKPDGDRIEFTTTHAACILALFGWQSAIAIRGREMIKCGMCHRTVGLWMFEREHNDECRDGLPGSSEDLIASETTPARSLDVLHEHRSYCPWIKEPKISTACSSSISRSKVSPPVSSGTCGGAAETIGWKRTRTIVMRACRNKWASAVTKDVINRQEPKTGPGMIRKTYDVLAEVRNILGPKKRRQE